MAKNPDSIKKNVKSKKINAYTKEECLSELARLETGNKDKKGNNVPDCNSRYQMDIKHRLATLK